MNPKEFLSLAKTLASSKSSAPHLRTATSRAYYAAHHFGGQLLSKEGCTIRTSGGGHSDVYHRLQNCGDQDVIAAGQQLSDLQSSRIDADYRLNKKSAENSANVEFHIRNAEHIINTIEQAFAGTKRTAMVAAIKHWEQLTGR